MTKPVGYEEYYDDQAAAAVDPNAAADLGIAESALDAQSITIDGVTVTERSIKEKIEAERYLASKRASAAPFGMRLARVNPGSAVRE